MQHTAYIAGREGGEMDEAGVFFDKENRLFLLF
jgi:hypothetical protein